MPSLPETRSDCARFPTTSHSPGGGLSRNDEPAGRFPVTLSKRSLNLLRFTGLPGTGWESGWQVSIEDLADPDWEPPREYFSGKARRVSMAGPYGPVESEVFHKYLNNQSLVPNQGLDSADPDSYHCCCFHSFGAVEEVVRGPRRPGSTGGERPMYVKFLGRGSGSAGAAAEYLLEERNAAGEEREEVEVLRGDPWRVAEVADSLEFGYRYTSGVIAWAPEDDPGEDEIEQTLEEFERTAWAGLEEERYAWSAVLHREAGLEVPRQGKHYVTARDPDSGSRWRLKGAIYEADFQRSRLVGPAAAETGAGAAKDRECDRQRAAQARRELEAHRERRAAYHRSRYGGSGRAAARDAAVGMAAAAGDRSSSLDRHLRGELGSDAVVGVADSEPDRDQGLPGTGDQAAAQLGDPAAGDSQGAVRGAAAGDAGSSALESGREACREALDKVRELYDRIGTAVDEGLARVVGAVRAGTEAVGRAGRGLAAAGRAAREAGAAVGPGLQAVVSRMFCKIFLVFAAGGAFASC